MNIVVIGLEARKDRWKRCVEIFKENKIGKVTHYVTEMDPVNTHWHYMQDFLAMLRLKRGEDLLFFEDDFELVPGWEDVLGKAWDDLPKDFDLLYLGANLTKRPVYVTDNLVRIRGAWFMHAVIMSAKFIDYVLKAYNPKHPKIIDEWYRCIAYERKFYMTYPMISYQREGRSDFLKRNFYYDIFENKYYKQYNESVGNSSRISATA